MAGGINNMMNSLLIGSGRKKFNLKNLPDLVFLSEPQKQILSGNSEYLGDNKILNGDFKDFTMGNTWSGSSYADKYGNERIITSFNRDFEGEINRAVDLNGTDEYMYVPVANNLLTNGTFETGINTDIWSTAVSGSSSVIWNDAEPGRTGNYNCKITADALNKGIYKASFLTVGKKYKIFLRYKGISIRIGNNYSSAYYKILPATFNWNTVEIDINCQVDGYLTIWSNEIGTFWLDDISIYEDQGFDLHGAERILHSTNRTFEGPIFNAVDLNGTDEYMTVDPVNIITGYSLQEDFSAGNFSNWTVQSGTFAVNNSVANPLSANQYSLVCNTAGIISIPSYQSVGLWEFDWYKENDANHLDVLFMNDRIGGNTTQNGYELSIFNTESVRLIKRTAGVYTGLLLTNTGYIANNTWYRIKIEKTTTGKFTIWLKGGSFGTDYVLISVTGGSGTNPVSDSTFTSSNYFVLDLDAGDRIANLSFQVADGSLDFHGHERIKHSANRDFDLALGNNLLSVLDFTNGWTASNAVINSTTQFSSTADGGFIKLIGLMTPGNIYMVNISGSISTGTFSVRGTNTGTLYSPLLSGSFNNTFYFTCEVGGTGVRLVGSLNGCVINISSLTLKNVTSTWSNYGNHSFDISSIDKKSGIQSLAISSTNAGGENADLLSGWSFTSDWAPTAAATINSGNTFTTTAFGGIIKGILVVGKTYKCIIKGTTTGTLQIREAGSATVYPSSPTLTGSFSGSFTFVSIHAGLYLTHASTGTTTITSLIIQEVVGEVVLPSSSFTPLSSGNKSTFEFWARGTGILGNNIIINNTFSNWSNDNPESWEVIGESTGIREVTQSDNNACRIYSSDGDALLISQNVLTIGKTYKLTINVASVSVGYLKVTKNAGAVITRLDKVGQITAYWIADNTNFIISRENICDVTIDYVSVQEVTKPSITVLIGEQSKTFTGISCIPGTFTKCVFNYQLTDATVGQPIRLFLNQADTVYMDDISLRRFYPTSISGWFKTNVTNIAQIIISKQSGSSSSALGYRLIVNTDNKFHLSVYDGNMMYDVPTNSNTYADEAWHYYTIVMMYDSILVYVDNTSINVQNIVGIFNNVEKFTLGKYSFANASFFGGLIGEHQFLRDYAKTFTEHLNSWLSGVQNYPGYETLRAKFLGTTTSNFLADSSGLGNNLTGVNVDISDQIQNIDSWRYLGNHTFEKTADEKRSGNYSGKMVSTAAGGLGSELIVNGGFDSDTWWAKLGSTVISDGVAHCNHSSGGNVFLYRSPFTSLTTGKLYKVSYDVNVYTSGIFMLYVGGTTGPVRNASGSYVEYITCGTSQIFGFYSTAFIGDIDNVSVKEVIGEAFLPADKYSPIVSGEKYTFEFWARGTGVLGNNLIPTASSDFSSDGTAYWTGGMGSINYNVGNYMTLTENGAAGSAPYIQKLGILTVGKYYKLSFSFKSSSPHLPILAPAIYTSLIYYTKRPQSNTAWQQYEIIFYANVDYLRLYTDNTIGVNSVTNDFDNLTLQEIIRPSITVAFGSQSKTFSDISIAPGTFTKCVFNFQAGSTEIGQPVALYSNQADSLYIDDIQFKKFYPTSISGWFKTGVPDVTKSLIAKNSGAVPTSVGLLFNLNISNRLQLFAMDGSGVNYYVQSTNTYTDNKWHFYTIVFDINTLALYVDNEVAIDSTRNYGILLNSQPFSIGRYSNVPAAFFSGQYGGIQYLRNYAKSQSEHLSGYQFGMQNVSSYSGTEEIGRWKFRGATDSTFLLDSSTKGNNLIGVNVTQAGDQVIGEYVSAEFWAQHGNHKIGQSTDDKKTGTCSGKITATGAGDSVSNYIELSNDKITAVEQGKYYEINISARTITQGTQITVVFGSKTVVYKSISSIAGTFTSLAFRFLATAAEVNQILKVFLNQADSAYIDDITLKERRVGTIGHWIFDTDWQTENETTVLQDLSGNGLNLIPAAAFDYTNQFTGSNPAYQSGKALFFDGINDEFSFSGYDFTNIDTWSIEAWIKVNNSGNNEHYLFSMSGGILTRTGGSQVFSFLTKSGTCIFNKDISSYTDKYAHYAIVADGAGNLTLYINGIQSATASGVDTSLNANIIGHLFKGEISEIRVSSNIMTPQQIKDSYGLGRKWTSSNMANYEIEYVITRSGYGQKVILNNEILDLEYKDILLEAGKLYKIDIWVRADNNQENFMVCVNHGENETENNILVAQTWTRIRNYFKAAGPGYLQFYIDGNPSITNTFYFDDIDIKEVTNSGFNGNSIIDFDNQANLTMQNSLVLEQPAHIGAIKYDGTGEYANFANPQNLSSIYLINCWIKRQTPTSNIVIFSDQDGNNSLYINTSSNLVHKVNSGADYQVFDGFTFAAGTWYLVSLVRNGSSLKLYVNSIFKQEKTFTSSQNSGFSIDRIGISSALVSTGHIGTICIQTPVTLPSAYESYLRNILSTTKKYYLD